jgi:hypothetical protein
VGCDVLAKCEAAMMARPAMFAGRSQVAAEAARKAELLLRSDKVKDDKIVIIVPEWDSLRDGDGFPEFPAPSNINEMCIIDRARHRELLKTMKLERFYCRMIAVVCVVSASVGMIIGMHLHER